MCEFANNAKTEADTLSLIRLLVLGEITFLMRNSAVRFKPSELNSDLEYGNPTTKMLIEYQE